MFPARPPALTSCTTYDHDTAVVAVSGELDLSTAPGLGEALAQVVERHPHALTVDLAGLAFIDSTGLTLLVRTSNRLREQDGTLSLASPTPPVRRVLEIVGLDHLLVA
jgi:anti-anti-sigma factor